MLTRNLARLLDIDEGLARRCVFAWTPRAGIFAGPLAGRQLSVTRATQQTVLQDDGRYYTLPNNALDPSGGIFMDLTNRAYYAHDCSRDLTGLTAGDALDSPVSGSTAYTLVEDNSTGEHKRSATCANLASGNQATSFCLKAGTREYFYVQVGNAADSLRVRAKMRWVNGAPVFQSWDNAGSLSPSPVLFVRRLWNDWWLITLFWSTTNTDPLLIAFGGTDASGGLSYA
ncbi:MAG: hypothetical protein N3A38_16265, partial [Planctomycetota bacterium]|nr:hypothetical protein [Planctomycetota bacterium]